jgi:hypothetical protein
MICIFRTPLSSRAFKPFYLTPMARSEHIDRIEAVKAGKCPEFSGD